ncbi:hypothetical protein [Streptomyces sp. NPDC091268]
MALFLGAALFVVYRHPRAEPAVPLLVAFAGALGTICFLAFLRLLRRRNG